MLPKNHKLIESITTLIVDINKKCLDKLLFLSPRYPRKGAKIAKHNPDKAIVHPHRVVPSISLLAIVFTK